MERPDLEWIAVASCEVDDRYQRTLESVRSQKLIEKIVVEWSWASCSAVLAMRCGKGRFKLIDGQHRVEAARRLGIDHLPGIVLAEMPLADQAAAFVAANNDRVLPTPYALHHARIVAGNIEAKKVDTATRAAGVSIPKYPIPADKMKPGQTMAIAVLYRLVKRLDVESATEVMTAVAEPFRTKPGWLRAPLFRAAGDLYEQAPTTAQRRETLRRVSIWLARNSSNTTTLWCTRLAEVMDQMRRGVARISAEQVVRVSNSSIKPPTRQQLMGAR